MGGKYRGNFVRICVNGTDVTVEPKKQAKRQIGFGKK
jgi:hypothetical protein